MTGTSGRGGAGGMKIGTMKGGRQCGAGVLTHRIFLVGFDSVLFGCHPFLVKVQSALKKVGRVMGYTGCTSIIRPGLVLRASLFALFMHSAPCDVVMSCVGSWVKDLSCSDRGSLFNQSCKAA